MNPIRCPKCSYHQEQYQAPLGKIVRNPYASKDAGPPVHDDCNACNGTGNIPEVVVASVTRFGERTSPEKAQEYLSQLRWSSDHYSFMCGGMYVGVETDGYLHT